jgi:hypothetical protein
MWRALGNYKLGSMKQIPVLCAVSLSFFLLAVVWGILDGWWVEVLVY